MLRFLVFRSRSTSLIIIILISHGSDVYQRVLYHVCLFHDPFSGRYLITALKRRYSSPAQVPTPLNIYFS
jgi:hypothetical protein